MAWLAGLPAPFRKVLDVGSSKAAWRRPTCHFVQVFNGSTRPRRGYMTETSEKGVSVSYFIAYSETVLKD